MKTQLKIVEKNDPIPTPVLCREIVKQYREGLRPPESVVNQHGDQVAPRMDVDEILSKSFKDIGKSPRS